MLRCCNGQMITDGEAMMVRQFVFDNFFISNLRVGVNFFIGVFFSTGLLSLGIFPGSISRENLSLSKTLGTKIYLGDVPG